MRPDTARSPRGEFSPWETRFTLKPWPGTRFTGPLAVLIDEFCCSATEGAVALLEGVCLAPDVFLAQTRADLAAGRDTVLEAALDWLRREIGRAE